MDVCTQQLMSLVLCFSCCLLQLASAAQSLGKYNVDVNGISVSGISSGAAMSTQMHVAYSSKFMGVGMVAGNPYWCAKGSTLVATGACMTAPQNIQISQLTTQTTSYASSGDIDATNNMYNDKVFILGGTLDTVVDQGVGMKAQQYYENYVRSSNIKTMFTLAAEHTFPTVSYGNACSSKASPNIGRCNYDAAYEMLNHFYGGLTKPSGSTALPGQFYEFDQSEFFYVSAPSVSSMDTVGYVYVPSACVSGSQCRLHVAFHGCAQGRYTLGDEYARNTGYNEIGELNNIIILYPQAISTFSNPMGCWDWWGYTINKYATKGANQPLAVWRMVEKVAY